MKFFGVYFGTNHGPWATLLAVLDEGMLFFPAVARR